eukprot:7136010-Pyramimonas_sp.AAC.1
MLNWVYRTHTGGSTGGICGAPYGATKRCVGWVKVPNWVFWTQACGPIGGLRWGPFMGPRNAVLGCLLYTSDAADDTPC